MQNYTLFISDLHLQLETPEVTERFEKFMTEQAPEAEALYILGDFFEAWIGDDDITVFNEKILALLNNLSQKIPIYFMHGNRDFLIGEQFLKAANMTLLPDPSIIQLYGHKILLTHGDMLCTLDIKHQKFRKFVLNQRIQKLFLSLPLWLRRKIANKLRAKSQHYNRDLPNTIGDVSEDEVNAIMEKHDVKLMIHGHTHQPKIHNQQRIVMGAWHDDADYVRFNGDGNFQLCQLN